MSDPATQSAQTQTIGKNVVYVTLTLPSGTGNATLLSNLILSGTEHLTGTQITTVQYGRIMAVAIRGHSASWKYGGAAATTPITVAVGTDRSEPAENFHLDTFVANVVTGTATAYAVCVLK